MSANLYDLLNVDESASSEEIRASWKAAVADLDPTDRRFRAFSDAASVLLDDDKRAAYDAELAAAREAEAAAEAAEADETAAPVSTVAADIPATPAPAPAVASAGPAGPPTWSLAVTGVAALAALVFAVVLLLQPGGKLFSDDSPKDVAEANATFERAAVSAEGAAERIIGPVFSYDYRTMDADLARSQEHLGADMAEKRARLWPTLRADAAQQQRVVTAKVEGTALTRVSEDGRRAVVLVFLVQESTAKGVKQTPLHNAITLDMRLADGSDDDWVIEDACIQTGCDRPE